MIPDVHPSWQQSTPHGLNIRVFFPSNRAGLEILVAAGPSFSWFCFYVIPTSSPPHSLSYKWFWLEKEVSTQSWVLAWRIPGMGEPGGLPSMGSHRVGYDWSDLAAAAACCSTYLNFSLLNIWIIFCCAAVSQFVYSLIINRQLVVSTPGILLVLY